MSKQTKKESKETPVLEINPSEEYRERPLWQKIGAWVLIVLIVVATGIIAIWPKL